MIDLHVHTSHSDGRLTPDQVVREAAQRGLSALAITDHDVLTGLPAAFTAANALAIQLVPGIELTTRWEGARAVHVLGYFVDVANPPLQAALAQARLLMAHHVEGVLRAVRAVGGVLEAGDLDGYRQRYAGGAALVFGMIQRGVLRATPPGTGMRLLRLAAEEPRAYSVAEAIDLIHGAGGVASLAHPAKLRRGRPLLSADELAPLLGQGFDALEAWQWIPGGWGSDHYQGVAEQAGLLVSGGSDDHGKRAADGRMRLGSQPIPIEVLEALRRRALERWAPA